MSQSQEYRPLFRRLPDDEGGGWLVEFPELPGCMADGETLEEALADAKSAVMAWIETARAQGRGIPSATLDDAAYSGKWVQRVPKSLHARLSGRAREEGVSLNTLVTSMLSESLGRRGESGSEGEADTAFQRRFGKSAETSRPRVATGAGRPMAMALHPEHQQPAEPNDADRPRRGRR